MPIVKLDKHFIKNNLQCPEDKRSIEMCDKNLAGLYIAVRQVSPGKGTFFLRYKDNTGKTCHQKIGTTTDISLADARKKAKELKAEISLGADPRREDRERKAVPTLTEFIEETYLPYKKDRKKSAWKDEDLFRLRIKDAFGRKRLNQITQRHLQAFHSGILAEGKSASTCNHYIKFLRHAFNLAVEWEIVDKNPAAHIKLFPEDNNVEHYMNKEELERLVTVLRTDENRPVCMILLFLLSTGSRLNETLKSEWKYVDIEHRVWRIPAANSKSKKVRSVPLNDAAIDILKQLDTKDNFKYLFINRKTGNRYTVIHKVWKRLREKAGLPHLRVHDLRHQYASLLINSGRTLYEVQQILGHSDPTVTQRYAHLSTTSLQEAANSASVLIGDVSSKK